MAEMSPSPPHVVRGQNGLYEKRSARSVLEGSQCRLAVGRLGAAAAGRGVRRLPAAVRRRPRRPRLTGSPRLRSPRRGRRPRLGGRWSSPCGAAGSFDRSTSAPDFAAAAVRPAFAMATALAGASGSARLRPACLRSPAAGRNRSGCGLRRWLRAVFCALPWPLSVRHCWSAGIAGSCLAARRRTRASSSFLIHVVAVVLRLLDGHLRLCGGDDAVVVLGVLQIVLGHDAVAGTHRIARQRRVFLGDLLRRAADLHVRAVALIVAGQRIGPLAVVIIVVVIVVVPPPPPPLLRPRMRLFCCCGLIRLSSSLKNHARTGARPAACRWCLPTLFDRVCRGGFTSHPARSHRYYRMNPSTKLERHCARRQLFVGNRNRLEHCLLRPIRFPNSICIRLSLPSSISLGFSSAGRCGPRLTGAKTSTRSFPARSRRSEISVKPCLGEDHATSSRWSDPISTPMRPPSSR